MRISKVSHLSSPLNPVGMRPAPCLQYVNLSGQNSDRSVSESSRQSQTSSTTSCEQLQTLPARELRVLGPGVAAVHIEEEMPGSWTPQLPPITTRPNKDSWTNWAVRNHVSTHTTTLRIDTDPTSWESLTSLSRS